MKTYVLMAVFCSMLLTMLPRPAAADGAGELAGVSWEHYNSGRYREAEAGFAKLLKADPSNAEYALGEAYSLVRLERLDEALRISTAFEGKKSDFTGIKLSILSKKAFAAFEKKDYDAASGYFARILDSDATKGQERVNMEEMAAWSLYNSGNVGNALAYFLSVYKVKKDPKMAEIIQTAYERLGMYREMADFAVIASQSSGPLVKKEAANRLYRLGCPIMAAQVHNEPAACWYNADTPEAAVRPFIRFKSGDAGTARLAESGARFSFAYPFLTGYKATVSMTGERLSASEAPSRPFAGHYDNVVVTRPLTTSVSAVTPMVSIEREGYTKIILDAGTTPLGGDVTGTPAFKAEARAMDWNVNVHRSAVDESILSLTGLKDPYGSGSWGRVVKTGVEGEYSYGAISPYWVSLRAGYDTYKGKETIYNDSYGAALSAGNTYDLDGAELVAGISSTYFRFKNNTGFYTYGHGGYFSPQRFIAAGPIIRYVSPKCRAYYLDASAGASYISFSTNAAKRYPLGGGAFDNLRYDGKSFNGMGYSADVRWSQLLAGSLHWGAELKASKSADYTQWLASLELRYEFRASPYAAPYRR